MESPARVIEKHRSMKTCARKLTPVLRGNKEKTVKYLGCAYYPEYWGMKRVAIDARLMQRAGINLVRIGEFAWCRMEPEDGRLTLDWLHETVNILQKHNIAVLLCTPTAAPPAWLTSAYPETLLVHADGRRAAHGSRRHYCPLSDTYRRFTARIVTALAQEMSRHPNVIGWQLDNEFGPECGFCHCETCQNRFREFLRHRYGSLDSLNRAWGTGFWSMDYSAWEQVRLGDRPDVYPSRTLDSKRFWSHAYIDYAFFQANIIRREHPQAMVTTNGMGPIYGAIDYYTLFGGLDVACDDLYFDIATQDANSLACNVFRSIKPGQAYWLTETGSGALDHGKPPHPDQFRAWLWSNFAHGGEAHVVFRWRTCLSGQEQELQGILEHSGKPRHRYRAVQRCFQEMRRMAPQLADLPLPSAQVAIVHDCDVLWAYDSSRVGRPQNYAAGVYQEINYFNAVVRLHRGLYMRHVLADVIPPQRSFDDYRCLLLSNLVMIKEDFARRLAAFVRRGGVVLALGQLGMRDDNANYLPYAGPDHLQELFGCNIEGGMYLRSHVAPDEALWVPKARYRETAVSVRGRLADKEINGMARVWAGDIELIGGRQLLTFVDDVYAGQPAVVERVSGKGRAIYAAMADMDEEVYQGLLDYALACAKVKYGPETPEFVEVVERGPATFVINHRPEAATVRLPAKGKALLGKYAHGEVMLPPFGVCVIRR